MGLRVKTIFLLFILCTFSVHSQSSSLVPTWSEFWKQKKTEKRYLADFIINNIGKLIVMYQGRSVANLQLDFIDQKKEASYEGDFKYIEGLSEIPSVLLESSYLKNIIESQVQTLDHLKKTQELILTNIDLLPTVSYDSYDNVISFMKESIDDSLDALESIIFRNDLKLKDNERLDRLIALNLEYTDKLNFALYNRMNAFKEIEFLKEEQRKINQIKLYNGYVE